MDPDIFENMDLSNRNLAGANLQNAVFTNRNLQDANLRGADLRDADLKVANLQRADLRNANLTSANLQRADLRNANLAGADFFEANLRGIRLTGANLTGANFRGVDLRGITINYEHLNNLVFGDSLFTNANLEGVDFRNSDLQGAAFTGANLQDVEFSFANLADADFDYANLEGADLTGANLTGATFERANLRGAFVSNNALTPQQLATIPLLRRPTVEVIPPVQAIPQQPVIRGVAFEIHNLFNTLNIDGITQYLNNFNSDNNHPINPNTIPNNQQGAINLFTPLIAFIDNSDLFAQNEKEAMKNNLQTRILPRVQRYENVVMNIALLTSVINFVSRQEDNFIEQYIRNYSQDCLQAYNGPSPESCVKGMVERIITSLNDVANQMLTEFPENQTYNDIKRLFPNIVFNEVVQEWAQKYLEDGEDEAELIDLTEAQRKQHFINFITEKYGALITASILDQINREAQNYETAGVFERRSFGGNRKIRRKRGNRKTLKKSKNRKTTKRRKGRKGHTKRRK